jgi:1-acyl-sn-glycerol-3-phosphate acyltransferase
MMVEAHPRAAGRILRWMHKKTAAKWGTDPRAYRPEAVASSLSGIGRLFGKGRYFELDVAGWGNIPASPAMLVSNHSGGTTIPDVWGFMFAWYRHFGVERPLHPMAHEMVLGNSVTGPYFAERGVLHGSRKLAMEVLTSHQRDLMVMPGGDLDTWRPYSKRYEVCFGGRTGYAKLALKAGVPIIPIANAGAHETLIVLTDGRPLARALHLHELARTDIFPNHWPHIPTPSRLRYRIGAPVLPPDTVPPGEEPSEELVRAYDTLVQAAVQGLLNELKMAS